MDAESWANAMLYIRICQACAIDVVGYLVFDLLLTVWCPCKCRWMREGGDRAWFYEEAVIHFSRLKKTNQRRSVALCQTVLIIGRISTEPKQSIAALLWPVGLECIFWFWAWRRVSGCMTHELSLAVRRVGVNDAHPGGSCQQNICFMAVIFQSQCRTSLSGALLNRGVPTLFQLNHI